MNPQSFLKITAECDLLPKLKMLFKVLTCNFPQNTTLGFGLITGAYQYFTNISENTGIVGRIFSHDIGGL